MIRGLYTAASGMVNGLRMQETVAENIANLGTPGYKGERSGTNEFQGVLARSIGTNSGAPVPIGTQRVLGRVGTGAYVDERETILSEGVERRTDLPLDVMIRGDGFFQIVTDDGIHYTRDGHFGRDATNTLVTADGQTVLGADGAPITINTDDVRILPTGELLLTTEVEVEVDGVLATEVTEEIVGQLAVVRIASEDLVRAGGSRFTLVPGAGTSPVELGEEALVVQGALEETNVDLAHASTDLMSLARVYTSNQRVFSALDDTLQLAVRDIGRVG